MKDKAENSFGRGKYELTQAYKSYANYAFPNDEFRHPRWKMKQIQFFVHGLMINFTFPIGKVYCGNILPLILLLFQELKYINRTKHQWLRLILVPSQDVSYALILW